MSSNIDLSHYVIYLEGEEVLVDLMMENNSDATAHGIKMGENQQPRSLSNLQHVISRKCHGSRIEEKEKSIRSATLLFGKTKKILEFIDMKRHQDSDHGKLIHIDEWHLMSKKMNPFCSMSSSTHEESVVSSPFDLYMSNMEIPSSGEDFSI
ncbi:hypothetical protein L1987_57517 [Smallanthus sonchifolius]|uniref:Uncharacterized protein n=1 Tax=Smallanthus sonchifolius TaxID=185202 RepID=A0ACB9DD14_9ASTR|nr:hypothetical protein L1987_57517 [Smallanthus sonchifolius]